MGVRLPSLGGIVAVALASAQFEWWGHPLPYFDHPYNTTALNERAVEIPIAMHWLRGRTGRGLEVGNVLGHYGFRGHRVVDRYERAPGVEHLDVFEIDGSYRWVVSISTVEHVRWDEPGDRCEAGSVDALTHLRALVAPGGGLLVTVPLGHHPALDAYLFGGDTGARRACTLVRGLDGWRQTESLTWRPYGQETAWAGSVWVGEWEGES